MKLDNENCHLIIFWNKGNDSVFTICTSTITESDNEKLLGVMFDKKVIFTEHVEDLCKKFSQKLHALCLTF